MKISCPVCSTTYMVPDTAIGEKGRKVKCASCGHQWHQDPHSAPSAAPVTDINTSAPAVQVPAVMAKSSSPGKLVAATIVLFIAGYFFNNFASFAESFGVKPTHGLAFDAIEVKVNREDSKLVAYISGEIRNETEDREIELPKKISFKLYSEQNHVMAETDYELPQQALAPGESVEITPKVGNISGNARSLTVDLGNGMENFFRE